MTGQAQSQPHGTADARNNLTPATLPLPPAGNHHETYIVQLKKDQVYRLPPPENALIMEKHRNPPDARNNVRCCPRLFLTITLTVFAIVAIIAMTLVILYHIFSPTGPTFSVTNVVVKNVNPPPPPSGNKNSRIRYQISFTAKNPNKRLGIEYKSDAEVLLLFDGKRVVATGKFPRLEQDPDASSKVMVELTGSNGPLPRQMEKIMDDSKSNAPIALDLEMKLRLKITAAGLQTWVMKSDVACTFEVTTLRNHTRVLSQECQTYFK